MKKQPVRWYCLLCSREGRSEAVMSQEQAIKKHAAVVDYERIIAKLSNLDLPGQCAGDVRLNLSPVRAAVPVPEEGVLPLDAGEPLTLL